MKHVELAIIGGGLATARAIRSYREAGGEGAITLFSKDAALPYHRPPLSKGYLRGETDRPPFVEDDDFYTGGDVELLLDTPVASVSTGARTVTTAAGAGYTYSKLLIASGAEPRRLDVPGTGLEGVHVLRTLADSDAIRAAAGDARTALVVGAGFVGMEVAASLRSLGLAVTLVHRGSGLFDQLGCEQLSSELVALYRAQGVDVVLNDSIVSFGGERRLAFATTGGGRRIDADMAVVGVGVAPTVGYLEGSGLTLEDGVVVDDRFQTNAPGVYAVGDVARFFDPLFGRRRRIEHWSNANYQGTTVGRLLAGQGGGYDTVSSFFTEVFGAVVKVFGDVTSFDEIMTGGSLTDRDLVATYGAGSRLVGALAVAPSEEVESRLKSLIEGRATSRAAGDELHTTPITAR